MSKLRLLFDQDEVICSWVNPVLQAHNEKYNTTYTRQDIKNYWDMEKLDPGGFDFMKAHFVKAGLYAGLEPFADAVETMQELQARGHELFIISAVPSGVAFDEKKEWIKKHLPFFPKKNFGALDRKDFVMGDILMDDAPHHLEDFAKTNRIAAIFDSPWNASLKAPGVDDFDVAKICNTVGLSPSDYMVRVKGWKEMLKLASKVSECFES
jgi:5'(3')-deoxyribonucleotidase